MDYGGHHGQGNGQQGRRRVIRRFLEPGVMGEEMEQRRREWVDRDLRILEWRCRRMAEARCDVVYYEGMRVCVDDDCFEEFDRMLGYMVQDIHNSDTFVVGA